MRPAEATEGSARANGRMNTTKQHIIAGTIPARKTKHPMLGRIERLMHRVEYRRMVDFEDRQAIFHLRRDAYARHTRGADSWAAPEIEDAKEPNAATVGVFIDDRLVGSFKILVVTADFPDCPGRDFFPDEVDQMLEKGQMLIDPIRFVSDPKAAAEFPELPFLLIKIVIMACQYFGADACLQLIKLEHASFYQRIFQSDIVAGPKWYDPLEVDAVLLSADLEKVLADVLDRFPCWEADHLELRQMFGPLSDWPAVSGRLKNVA